MRYLSMIKGEREVEELSKERVESLLKACYNEEFVDDIIDNSKAFRLMTSFREIWTETYENGNLFVPTDFGVCD